MAIHYDLIKTPLIPGETREFTVIGLDSIRGEIRCFVRRPPPPGYKPCSACGSFELQPTESIPIHADKEIFSEFGGALELDLYDDFGNHEKVTLSVNRWEDGDNEGGQSGDSGLGGLERAIEYTQEAEQSYQYIELTKFIAE